MKGWFDAFREDGGPTFYPHHNRTAVAADVTTLAVVVAAATVYIAFLVVFPGIRKERFSTFAMVTLSLFTGTVILVCKHGSSWYVAKGEVPQATYRAFSSERIDCWLAVNVGLAHVNVTLIATRMGNESTTEVDYNERFNWAGAGEMEAAYRDGLRRGLPYPVLTVAEYFSVGQEGFDWGGKFRSAGYCTGVMLWAALACWVSMNLLLVTVPRYGALALLCCGALLAGAAASHRARLTHAAPPLTVDGAVLTLKPGNCFYIAFVTGVICAICGALAFAVDLVWPHRLTTALEVHYDTPYDRHVLISDSHEHRTRSTKPHINSGPPLHARILRRLSSKSRAEVSTTHNPSVSVVSELGRDNPAYDRAPKSPWRYPHIRRTVPPPVDRADSASSFASSTAAGSAGNAGNMKMSPLVGHAPLHRIRTMSPKERVKEMW